MRKQKKTYPLKVLTVFIKSIKTATLDLKKSNLSSHTGQLTAEEEEIKYDLQKQSPYAGRSRFGLDE